MSVQDFFDEFLIILPGTPPPSKTPNLFGKLAVQKKILIFKIVDTSSHPDIRSHTGKKIKPGPSMYRTTLDTSTKVTQFNKLELHFELELADTDDPFCDPLSSDIGRTEWEFESQANKGRDCQGQLTKYPIEWCSRGHLTFAFTILIFGSSARFIRWDRSAAVVSEKFSYKMNRQPLGEFLWYFTRMDDVGRGKDDTVRESSVEETRTAHDMLKKWKPKLERSVVVFTIQVDSKGRNFLGWGSMANGESLIGRATRAYPVRDVQEKVLRFLKDSWRGMHFGSESDILRTLNDACIRNVPQLICGEDIDGHCHSTRSHSFAANYMDENIGPKRMLWECGIHNTMQRVYYRLVSRDIGLHLIRFKSSKDLMQVVYDAFIAHKEAYEKCNILHGDISDKNVMMKENGDGFLNDWDLAKCVTVSRDAEEIPRDHERTGTWQFISTPNLLKPGKVHTAQDDMESFFHLVLYHGIKYLQHTPLRDARATMVKIFDECSIDPAGTCRGGDAKYSMFMNRAHIERNFAFTDNAPLTFWLNFSMGAIKQWIEYEIPPIIPDHAYLQDSHFSRHRATVITEPSQSLDFSRLILKDHTAFVEIWQDVLSHPKWPDNDKTSDQVPPVTAKSLAASSKRARNEAEQESSNKRKKSMSSHHIPIQGSSLRQSRISSGSG